jgi:hypothetical protein
LRLYFDYACEDGGGARVNYWTQYVGFNQDERMMTFSPAFQGGDENPCAAGMGELPDAQLAGSSPLADTNVLSNPRGQVQVFHSPRQEAPPPPGFSEINNIGFFWYTVRATAAYGEQDNAPMITRGQATARARMYMGPHRK